MRQIALAIILASLMATFAFPASAHIGGGAYILVPLDHVVPGQRFEVIAADMGPGATVAFHLARDETVVPLENATANPDGHFTTMLSLPADYPDGYTQLVATADDGSQASTWILVGERTEATPAPPSQSAWWSDPSVIVLLIFLLGAAAVVGYLLLRPKSPVRAAAPNASRRAVPRKRPR